jgi:hypothetical protein
MGPNALLAHRDQRQESGRDEGDEERGGGERERRDVIEAVEYARQRRPGQTGAVDPHLILGERERQLLVRHDRPQQQHAGRLIEVAATRMVSGTLEQRYRARQNDLRLSAALFRQHTDESEAAVRTAFDTFLADFFDQARKEGWPDEGPDKPILVVFDDQVSPASAERIRARLAELKQALAEAELGDVQLNVALGFYQRRT